MEENAYSSKHSPFGGRRVTPTKAQHKSIGDWRGGGRRARGAVPTPAVTASHLGTKGAKV